MENLEVNGEFVTVVADGATVGQVIGHQANTFNYNQESPEEMFAAARNYLAINASQRAVELIEQAMARGLDSSEVAYFWQLALLADKPFDHLSHADHQKIIKVHRRAKSYASDDWTAATKVVADLPACYTSRLSGRGFDEDLFDYSMTSFDALSEARREEMVRHISVLLESTKSDRLDQEQRAQIKHHRMGDERRWRVPLFFDPDPARPQPRPTSPTDLSAANWTALVLGLAACGWGLYLLGRGAVRENPMTGWPTVVWVLVSCLAAGVYGLDYVDGLRRIERYRVRVEVALALKSPAVEEFITRWFGPAGDVAVPGGAVHVERALLVQSLCETYPDPTAPELDWLIRWHAARAKNGRPVSAMPTATRQGKAAASAVALVLALFTQVVTMADWTIAVIFTLICSAVLFAVGIFLLRAGIAVIIEPRRHATEIQDHQALLRAEESGWEAEVRRLAHRPDDSQMAKWLDFDTLHLRLAAMKRWGLSNDDVLAHVVLTEADQNSRVARESGCPRRYARYIVRLFLLTGNGVRQLDVKLDFATGAENDEWRKAFKYDAIASAVITEPTVRKYGRRQVATPDGGGPDGQARPIRRQSMTLTLVSGERYVINADYESGLADEHLVDPEALAALEMETSGAVGTLRMLESVAGEGRGWITKERERLRAAAQGYQEAKV